MNQQQVRRFIERYLDAFSAHIIESRPAFLTVKLPEQVDKDIGNRPFYWSWVEKMNLPHQPLTLTFCFDPAEMPADIRHEPMHFGAARLQQIFHSTQKHGKYVCLYEQPAMPDNLPLGRQTSGLTPWLGVNLKISFICDKKRDILLYLGVNLHQPRAVHDFYPFVRTLKLSPSIPNYVFTLDQQISLEQAMNLIEEEVQRLIDEQDEDWAIQARDRLQEELAILESYYEEMINREAAEQAGAADSQKEKQESVLPLAPPPMSNHNAEEAEQQPERAAESGSILAFLRAYSLPQTPKEEIDQQQWTSSTPAEEKQRRREELIWQYEPRIEVSMINGGLFYLSSHPQARSEHHGERGNL